MNTSGLEGLKKHLTAKAVVGFDYQDKMTGSIEMDMIKEGDVWKIDGLSSPKFEKFTLKMENE
jgi:hypothetical protein